MATVDAVRSPASPAGAISFEPLPQPTALSGPVSRRIMRRTAVAAAVVWAAAIALVAADVSAGWNAFALGMLLPGAGFAYSGSWVLVAVGALVWTISFFIFFLLSPMWLPAVAWVGLAAVAAVSVDGGDVTDGARLAVPLVLAGLLVLLFVGRRVTLSQLRKKVVSRNAVLAERTWAPPVETATPPILEPLTDEQLATMRFALDLALQPLDKFDGFTHIDQFRESAYRYQLNSIGWGLSMAQSTRIPAFSGYVEEAQRNAIDKMQDPAVWKYWRWENLIGNLKWDPNPISWDNIMLPGYYIVQLGAYESVSGDQRYSEPDCLVFDDGKRRYSYDFGSMSEVVRDNMRRAALCMYSCEPNWVYPSCNLRAVLGLILHDRLHGTDLLGPIRDDFRRSYLDELSFPDDRIVTMRSHRLGFAVPGLATSAIADSDVIFWMSPFLPDIAARRWEFYREHYLSVEPDGTLGLHNLGNMDRIDPGNYQLGSKAWIYTSVMLSAQECGDSEMYAAAKAGFERDYSPAVRDGATHSGGSNWARLTGGMAQLMRPWAWHDLINRGIPDTWVNGPHLAEAPYPDALVALAVSDGRDLTFELAQGNGGGRVDLVLDRLAAGGTYRVEGAIADSLTATDDGRAALQVDLDGRRRARVVPA